MDYKIFENQRQGLVLMSSFKIFYNLFPIVVVENVIWTNLILNASLFKYHVHIHNIYTSLIVLHNILTLQCIYTSIIARNNMEIIVVDTLNSHYN